MKLWVRLLCFVVPIVGIWLWRAGIGVTDEHLVLKGFGEKRIAWPEIASLRRGAGVLDGALGRFELTTRSGRGPFAVPVGMVVGAAALREALAARGVLSL